MKSTRRYLAAAGFIFILFTAYSQTVETVIQTGHYAEVTAVCYTYDGRFIITGSEDKTVKLWRRSDGLEIRTYQGNISGIASVNADRKGSAIMSVSSDGTLTTWDLNTGRVILQFRPEGDRFNCASFSPDGSRIIAGTRKSFIIVFNALTGEKISVLTPVAMPAGSDRRVDYTETRSASYSSDGSYIIAGTADYTAVLFDAATGREIRKYKRTNSTCSSCFVEAIITSDNRYVISAYSDSVKIFDRESGKLVRELYGQGSSPEFLCASHDNRYLAGIEYGVAEVWDMKTWKLITKTGSYSERKVTSMAVSPDGKDFAAGNEKRTADIVQTEGGKLLRTLKGYLNQADESILTDSYMHWASMVNEARLSPDGKYITVGRTGNNAKLIDFSTGKIFRTLKGHDRMVISLCFSSDGRYLASGGIDGRAIVWEIESGREVMTAKFPDDKNAVYSVDISADGKYLATADWGGMVVIWEIATGKRVRAISPHNRTGCYQVRLLPNNVYFLSAGLDRKLKLTEIDTGEEIRNFIGHTDLVNSINMAPSGDKFITASWDGSVRIWDIASGLQLRKINAHSGGVYNAKFDRSGKYIVSGGDDFLVKLWDAATGEPEAVFTGHSGGVGDVNLTPDMKHIVSGSRDGSVRIWDIEKKRELASLIFLNEEDWFIKNPEGYFDASEGAYNSISFVKGTEIYNISQFFNEFYRPGLYREIMGSAGASFRQNLNQTIEKYPPPSVEFVIPGEDLKTESPLTSFLVKVTNNGGGVKEFRVMQNGKRQDVDYSDLKRMSKAGQYAIKAFDLHLVPGINEITATAFSNGEIESRAVSLNVEYSGLQKTSDCYLLSIGINRYANDNLNLTFARPDARAFAEVIESRGSGLFNRINSTTLFDGDATREKILEAIDRIGRVMKKEDVFIFFYAGHGSMVENKFYFITAEVTGLYQQDKLRSALYVGELQEKFRLLPALKQVVFIDACQSGSSVEALAMRGGAEEKALAQLSRSSGIHVMASSESQQQSAEIKSLNHGVFTYVLLEALNGKADGAPADSKVTVYEIKSYIDDQVPDISYRLIRHKQFPSTFSIGHDFPLVMD